MGGDAGRLIAEFGNILGDSAAVTSALVNGDFEGAAKAGAEELAGALGNWTGDQIRDTAHSLGNHVGGLKAGDAAEDALKYAAGDAFDKGLDIVNGNDTANADDHDDSSTGNDSVLDKGWHAAESAFNGAVDTLNDAVNHPEGLLDQGTIWIGDHFNQEVTNALDKVPGALAAIGQSNGSDEDTTGTTHLILPGDVVGGDVGHALPDTIDLSGFWDGAARAIGLGLDTSTSQAISSLIETLHAETTASAVANAHVPLLEASPLPSLGGDPRGDFSDHASWSMLNPQPLPPGPGEARSLHNAIFGMLEMPALSSSEATMRPRACTTRHHGRR